MAMRQAPGRGKARALIGWFALLVGTSGCPQALFGTGTVYIWNGTLDEMTVHLEGRTVTNVAVAGQSGHALSSVIAGSYVLTFRRQGLSRDMVFELPQGQTAVVNLAAASCFARSDIIGLYGANVEPVRIIETYPPKDVLVTGSAIRVFPGELIPTTRPRSSLTFQRISAVPCELLDPERKSDLVEFVRYQR